MEVFGVSRCGEMVGCVSDSAWLGRGLLVRCGSRILRGFDGKRRERAQLLGEIWS
jgi:hypothetical protein